MNMGLRTVAVLVALCGAGLGWLRYAKDPGETGAISEKGGAGSAARQAKGSEESHREAGARPRSSATSGRLAGSESVLRYLRSDEAGKLGIIEEWVYLPDGDLPPDDVAERLGELHAKESDEALRQELLDALVWVASGAAFDAILEISKAATDEEQREAASSALEQVIEDLAEGEEPAWDRVFRGMEADLPQSVRITAIQAAMNGGNASMIPRLRAFARDADPEVREAAKEAVDWLREE